MSDIEVKEIKVGLQGADFPPLKKTDKPRKERGIVFEQPTEAELTKSYGSERATPLVDAQGRPRWINTRECWCSHTADDECRFHSRSEAGWEECPSKPKFEVEEAKPRMLYATNPDFGKPAPKAAESANEEEVEQTA